MAHYEPEIEFTVATAIQRWGRADGCLHGHEELRRHFERGLVLAPDLHFELEQVFAAPTGYAILYRRNNGTVWSMP